MYADVVINERETSWFLRSIWIIKIIPIKQLGAKVVFKIARTDFGDMGGYINIFNS